MAWKTKTSLLMLCGLISYIFQMPTYATEVPLGPQVPSPEKVAAFKQYWESFDAYEAKIIQQGKSKYQESWLTLQEIKAQQKHEFTLKQIELLEEAAYEYKLHLKNHNQSENTAFVRLNLAQILNKIGDLKNTLEESGVEAKQEALAVLDELNRTHTKFQNNEAALYLKAIILSGLGADSTALTTWRKLSSIAKSTLYGVHAKIAIGDHYFKTEKAVEALREYNRAETLLASLEAEDKDFEQLRIQYRQIWASYRSADLKTTISSGIRILQPDRVGKLKDFHTKIADDAVQLIGDALYELNDIPFTKATIKRSVLKNHAGKIVLRTLRNYFLNNIFDDVIELGEYGLELYPANEVAPEILAVVADAYKGSNNPIKRIETLEKMALFLPRDSLWRTRHKDEYLATRSMEKLARAAANTVSNHYYQKGMSSGNPSYFEAASSYFSVLINQAPNGKNHISLRLKRAHCYFFSEKYKKAAYQYEDLIKNHDIEHSALKIAAFQLVLTREKIWRKSYARSLSKGQKPQIDGDTLHNLSNLENSVESFSTRFPPKAVNANNEVVNDALLIAASANRDHDRFKEATKYWQRVLISNPASGQRAIAIRGIVMAKVHQGNPGPIIETTKNFLRLERWRALGLTLDLELRGILTQATKEEAARLEKKGDYDKAGALQVKIAEEFPRIPDQAKIYRDGIYMLAMGGKWLAAESAANRFIDKGIQTHLDDVSYLKAKALDYQMRFPEAAREYLRYGKKFPLHRKAKSSIQRSIEIGKADGNLILSAKASELLGDTEKSRSKKVEYYKNSYEFFKASDSYDDALRIAIKRKKVSKSLNEILPVNLDIAKAQMQIRSEDEALENFEELTKTASINRDRINKNVYQSTYGEAQFYLAKEAIAQLHDFNILERGGNLRNTVNQKLRYFEKVVQRLELATKSGHPEWSSRCRYLLGKESDDLADHLYLVMQESNTSDGIRETLREQVQRLRKMAKVHYSTNLLAQSRNPTKYKNNLWIKKSRLRVSAYTGGGRQPSSEHVSPSSLSLNIPQQWSTE